MDPRVLEYLQTQRVCVLAVEMPDGSPHAATVNFTYIADPLTFIVMTGPTSRKYEALATGRGRASIVIGVDESDMRTLQLNGYASLFNNGAFQKLYHDKFPKAARMFPIWEEIRKRKTACSYRAGGRGKLLRVRRICFSLRTRVM